MSNQDDNYIVNANRVLELIANQLYIDGIIKSPSVVMNNYIVGVARPGLFSSAYDKLTGLKPNEEGKYDGTYVIFQIPKQWQPQPEMSDTADGCQSPTPEELEVLNNA
jgi:hypothetical protein